MERYAFALVAALLLLAGCTGQSPQLPLKPGNNSSISGGTAPVPSDFVFAYSFGAFGASKYDSASGIFSRDTSCAQAGSLKQKDFYLPLTSDEKAEIYRAITENGLFFVKENMTQPYGSIPLVGATLAFTANGRTRTVSWSAGYEDDADYRRFANATGQIDEILDRKREQAGADNICFYR